MFHSILFLFQFGLYFNFESSIYFFFLLLFCFGLGRRQPFSVHFVSTLTIRLFGPGERTANTWQDTHSGKFFALNWTDRISYGLGAVSALCVGDGLSSIVHLCFIRCCWAKSPFWNIIWWGRCGTVATIGWCGEGDGIAIWWMIVCFLFVMGCWNCGACRNVFCGV